MFILRRRPSSFIKFGCFFPRSPFCVFVKKPSEICGPQRSHGHPVVRRQNAVATRVVLATASNGHVPRGAGHEITDAKYGPGIVVEALLSVVAV